ncbi:MAG: type IV secretion system DNA-binding domain-containing protein [Patescibacteria group bacterium]
MSDNELIFIGETNFRGDRMRFGIKNDDRRRHMYVVGSTGMGKSEFLKSIAIQDIETGHGIAFIDPHGDPSVELLDYIPEERIKDVIYFDPGDLEYPIAFNVMEQVPFEFRHLVASGLLGVFKKIWGAEVWSGRMEYILNNTILALLETPDSTLLGINRMMANKDYRKTVVANIKDPIVKAFWVDEFAKYADKFATEATAAIQNKIGGFISNNLIRNVISQSHSTIDMRKAMDEGKILIANLSRGRIGEDASRLLGALLVTKIQLAAMSRVDIPEPQRRDFYLVVDEFQHFATESFVNILSEARKFHLSLVMAHQYIKQMEEPVMDAVFGNVGTLVSFRVGADDAEFLEKWFSPDFMMADIVNLGKRQMYIRLMIDGISSRGFSAITLERFPIPDRSWKEKIIEHSRQKYATRREVVEKNIAEWAGSMSGGASEERPERASGPYREERQWPGSARPQRDEGRSRRPDGRPRFEESQPFRREPYRSPPSQTRPQSSQTRPRPVSLSDAFDQGTVDFKGRKREEQPKKEVDTAALKKILEESLRK